MTIRWSRNDRVLVFAAHSDDETLGVGGSIAAMVQEGVSVGVAVATDSASAQYDDREAVARRRSCFEQAMEILGVETKWNWNAPDMRLSDVSDLKLNGWVSDIITRWTPNVVLTPWLGDVNADHRRLTEAVHVGCRPRVGSPVRLLAEYETASSTEWGAMLTGTSFHPNLWSDITETVDLKIQALKAYVEELRDAPHPRSVESVRSLASWRGAEVGFCSAEAFVVRYQLAAKGD